MVSAAFEPRADEVSVPEEIFWRVSDGPKRNDGVSSTLAATPALRVKSSR